MILVNIFNTVIFHLCRAEADLLRLTEISAAEAFIDSAEVVIIGFFEVKPECVWVTFNDIWKV